MGSSSKRAEQDEETKSVRQGYLNEAQVNQTETTQPLPIFGGQKKETTTAKKKVLSTSEVEKKLKSQCETQQ
jgi:hypothetical protein